MTRHTIARLVVSVLLALAVVACSVQSPLAPSSGAQLTAPIENAILLSQPVLGQYYFEFVWNEGRLTIVMHVRDAAGAAPEGGTVVLQYCSYNGYPTDDITQPDEAPSSACADHSGHWVTLTRSSLNPLGDASLPFGPVSVVEVIGFRLRYTGQGSGVENGTHVEDWVRPL